MDVQADIGHVVQVFASDKPDDLADRTRGIMSAHAGESVRVDLFVFCQLRHIVQCGAFRIRKKRTGPVFIQRIELGLVHGRFYGERPANVHAEQADVDARYLFPDQQNSFPWQLKRFVEPADLRVEETKGGRQPRAMDLEWGEDLPNLAKTSFPPVRKYPTVFHIE